MTGKRQNAYFRKLLVGYDGSPQSERAVDIALSLAECLDATVLIFAVARPPEPSTSVELEAVVDNAKEHFEEGFKKIMERARGRDLNVKTDMALDIRLNKSFTGQKWMVLTSSFWVGAGAP